MESFCALLAICAGNSSVPGQWRGALIFTLICARINGWVNNCKAGDLRRSRAHYHVIVMTCHGLADLPISDGQLFLLDCTWIPITCSIARLSPLNFFQREFTVVAERSGVHGAFYTCLETTGMGYICKRIRTYTDMLTGSVFFNHMPYLKNLCELSWSKGRCQSHYHDVF